MKDNQNKKKQQKTITQTMKNNINTKEQSKTKENYKTQ